MAALEEVSARRMAAYRDLLDRSGTLAELIAGARGVFEADLDAGHVTVLTEMISGAQSVPGLGERVAAVLAPWRDFAATPFAASWRLPPSRSCFPPTRPRTRWWPGLLGLEMLANLDGDRAAALALVRPGAGAGRRA